MCAIDDSRLVVLSFPIYLHITRIHANSLFKKRKFSHYTYTTALHAKQSTMSCNTRLIVSICHAIRTQI